MEKQNINQSYKNKNRNNRHKHSGNFQHNNSKKENVEFFPKITLDTPICPRCNQPIQDLATSLADKTSGAPMHFDCVLDFLNSSEKLQGNEKITYIGQGRFAVAYFENPHDLRHFSIKRIIEWEEKEKKYEWRENIADLFSKIK